MSAADHARHAAPLSGAASTGRLKVLAFDYDGTLTEGEHLHPDTRAALRSAQAAGHVLVLVTGRILERLPEDIRHGDLFAAIVAENGAAVSFAGRMAVALPFGRLNPELLAALVNREVPHERGLALFATRVPHDRAVEEVLRAAGGGASVEYNKGAVMVLPPGATKGAGLQYALHELGYSLRNTLACGDAENDRSMFTMCELAVAVGNVSPSVKAVADLVLPWPNGKGVRHLIDRLLSGTLDSRTPHRPERQMVLGHNDAGEPVGVPCAALLDGNLAVLGASRSGKSWLAGLLTEQLCALGYQVCVIDPEGDYRTLRALPHMLVLGGPEGHLPEVSQIITILEYAGVSLVLDFSLYSVAARNTYTASLLRALRALRAQRGRPHWILLDELQNLCTPDAGALTRNLERCLRQGGVAFVAYRAGQLPASVLQKVRSWLLTTTQLPEDLDAVGTLLAGQGHDAVRALALLPGLARGEAALFSPAPGDEGSPQGQRFQASPRVSLHVRHLHKYLLAPLPPERRFYFRDAGGTAHGQAASLWEFRERLNGVPPESLAYHLTRGDFEAWLRTVIHDEPLARQMHKLAHLNPTGDELRTRLTESVQERYAELERLT
ncbi:HAD-IIB family hydrolase [Deinococcus aerophilus]|uniref:Phosphoglycolate phosphatase n=1 Tax=Deinococcus aerophilus TaxID=522488 RepID=A0ABQ2GZS9_9DEIO|nr:HAD-IIB family hydrolase [Deinococcus aerophilus]GGM19481.1 phosphoglycolate phosphatase [Deinococcus aerophilus]